MSFECRLIQTAQSLRLWFCNVGTATSSHLSRIIEHFAFEMGIANISKPANHISKDLL